MARLATSFRVGAWIRMLDAAGRPAYVRQRGDAQAGAVMVVAALMDGRAQIYTRIYGADGEGVWAPRFQTPAPEAEADRAAAAAAADDPDLWVVEVEDPSGEAMLAEGVL